MLPLPNRLLATGPLVKLGVMAYSLYLWHWPLLIFWLAYTGHPHANFFEGTAVLLISGVLAHLTNQFVEEPLRHRGAATAASEATPVMPWRTRLRRPTMVLGSVVGLLGVTLTATAFTWREHVSVERASGKQLSALSSKDYPGARALVKHMRVPTLRMRPTVLEAQTDYPPSTPDGCISDFANTSLITCTYGDKNATRTIALAGGSHAEHWLTALDLLGRKHHFKVTTYLKMGCPLSTEKMPLVMGNNAPYPECRDWVPKAMAKVVADHPDYVFTTSTRPWNIKPGDVMPGTYVGIWQTFSDNNIPILAMRDTPWLVKDGQPFNPPDCLAKGGDAISCGIKRADVLADHNPTLDWVEQFPIGGDDPHFDGVGLNARTARSGPAPLRSRDAPVRSGQWRRGDSTRAAHHMARKQLSTGRYFRRWRYQLLAVLRDRRRSRVVPDRRRRSGSSNRPRRGRRIRVARLPAECRPGTALRLSGARAVRPGGRPPM